MRRPATPSTDDSHNEDESLVRVEDFDLGAGTARIHGKGDKIVAMRLASSAVQHDLDIHLVGRDPGEVLVYGKAGRSEADEPRGPEQVVQALPDTCRTALDDADARAASFGRGQPVPPNWRHWRGAATPQA